MSSSDPEVRRLAERIVGLEKRANAGPQLAYSSIDDGALTGVDKDGNLVLIVGKQWDGSNLVAAVNGPIPPSPAGYSVTPVIGGLIIDWEGVFYQGAYLPADYARVEIHASDTPGFMPTFISTLRGTYETPRGGQQFIALPMVEHEIVLVTRTLSGRISPLNQILRVRGTPKKVSDADLDFNIGELGQGTRIYYGPDKPGPDTTGDEPAIGEFWVKEPENILFRYGKDGWDEARDQGILDAILAAREAGEKASAASAAALASLNVLANQGVATYSGPEAPSGARKGAYWIDTSRGNTVKTWDGTQWVVVTDDQVVAAVSNAATAVAIADGKMRIFVQGTMPAPVPAMSQGDVGDTWIDTSRENLVLTWSGSSWTPRQFGNTAIYPKSLVAKDVVATGTITGGLLDVDMVLAGRVVGGTLGGRRVELRPEGIFAYDYVNGVQASTFSATGSGAFIRGVIEATTFRSVGYFSIATGSQTNGVRYIEIGAAFGNEAGNDEIRFRGSFNSAASIRNPVARPGRFRVSTKDDQGYEAIADFDPRLGLITERVSLVQGPGNAQGVGTTHVGFSNNSAVPGGIKLHDSNNVFGSDIHIGSVESQHGWVGNNAVGLSFLAGTQQVNVRNGANSGYASLRALNLYYTGTVQNLSAARTAEAPADPLELVRTVDIFNPGEPVRREGPLRRGASVEDELPPERTLDLPAPLASPDGTAGSVLGVMETLWLAVRDLDGQVQALRGTVA